MIASIATAQVVVQDLPQYVRECKDSGVLPLMARPNGWTKIENAQAVKDSPKIKVVLLDPMYGEEDHELSPTLVVGVATYVKIEVAE